LDELFGTLPDEQKKLLKDKIDRLQERELIVSTHDDRLRLLPKGLSLENEIIDQLSVW